MNNLTTRSNRVFLIPSKMATITTPEEVREYTLKAVDYEYRAEGNCSVVISLIKEKKILRFLKGSPNESAVDLLQTLKLGQNFVKEVLLPLFGQEYVHIGEIVRIPPEDIRQIIRDIDCFRPEFRKSKSLNESHCYAVLMPDLCFIPMHLTEPNGPTLAVEIKPKMGFLPTSSYIPESTGIRKRVCRYQLQQQHKLHHKKIRSTNKYCPLDLFSGCRRRMNYALGNLLENPQNNLRVFQNGRLIFDENTQQGLMTCLRTCIGSSDEPSLLSDFRWLVIESLLQNANNQSALQVQTAENNNCACGYGFQQQTDSHICTSQCQLPSHCVLSAILKVQKLDDVDIEGIEAEYKQIKHLMTQNPSLDNFFYTGVSTESIIQEASVKSSFLKVKNFLTSTTAKDCSVLIALQRYNGNSVPKDQLIWSPKNIPFMVKASIVDLDPKPHQRIPEYLRKERDFAEGYLQSKCS